MGFFETAGLVIGLVITAAVILPFVLLFGALGLVQVFAATKSLGNEKERVLAEKSAEDRRIALAGDPASALPPPPAPPAEDQQPTWLKNLLTSRFARLFYIVGGWWAFVLLWKASGCTTVSNFFLSDHLGYTIWTPLFACFCEYYNAPHAPKIMKSISLLVSITMACIWLFFAGDKCISWLDIGPSTSTSTAVAKSAPVAVQTADLPVIVATKNGWTAPIDLRAAFKKHFGVDYGRQYIVVDDTGTGESPGQAKVVYNGVTTLVNIKASGTGETDYGKIETLSFKVKDDAKNSTMTVHITLNRF